MTEASLTSYYTTSAYICIAPTNKSIEMYARFVTCFSTYMNRAPILDPIFNRSTKN